MCDIIAESSVLVGVDDIISCYVVVYQSSYTCWLWCWMDVPIIPKGVWSVLLCGCKWWKIAGKVRAAAHGTWHMAAGQPVSVRSHSFVPRPVDSGATEAARSLFLLCWWSITWTLVGGGDHASTANLDRGGPRPPPSTRADHGKATTATTPTPVRVVAGAAPQQQLGPTSTKGEPATGNGLFPSSASPLLLLASSPAMAALLLLSSAARVRSR